METKGKKLHRLDGRISFKDFDAEVLDLLISYRHRASISPKNHYLFAKSKNEYFDAHRTMKTLVALCHSKYKAFEN